MALTFGRFARSTGGRSSAVAESANKAQEAAVVAQNANASDQETTETQSSDVSAPSGSTKSGKVELASLGNRFARRGGVSQQHTAAQQEADKAAIAARQAETGSGTVDLSTLGNRFTRDKSNALYGAKTGDVVTVNGKQYYYNSPKYTYDISDAIQQMQEEAAKQGLIIQPEAQTTDTTYEKSGGLINRIDNVSPTLADVTYDTSGGLVIKKENPYGEYTGQTVFDSKEAAQAALDAYAARFGMQQYDISSSITSVWDQIESYGASGSVKKYTGETVFSSETEAQAAIDAYVAQANVDLSAWGENQPVTIYDSLGREQTVSAKQYKQMLSAQSTASKYDNYYVLPEEVANSQADWWINSKGLYEWTPVTAGDIAELALENKQRKQLGQSEKTTLTAGAVWSDEFTKNWYSTGGGNRGTGETGVKIKSSSGDIVQTFDYDTINRAVTGSGDVKLSALKESSSINASASAITNTAQQQKATVIEKVVASMVETPIASEKKTDVSNLFGAGFVYGAKAEAITAIAGEFVNPTGTITLDVTDAALKAAQAKGAKVSRDVATGTILYTDEKSKKIYEAEYGKAASEYSAQWSAALNLSPEKTETQEKVDTGIFGALKLGWAAGTGKTVNMEGWESRSVELSGFSQKLIDVADSVTKRYDATQEGIFGNLGVAGDFLTGVTNIPQMLLEGALIIPAGLESTAKNPTAAADYFLAGTGAMFGSIYTKAKGNPAELAGELAGAVALGKVSAKVTGASKSAKTDVYSVNEVKVNKAAVVSETRIGEPSVFSRVSVNTELVNPFNKLSTAEQYAKSVTERGMKSKGETIAEKAGSIDITELTRGNSLLEMKVESAHLYKDAFSGLSTAEQYAKSVTERGMKSKGETIAEKAGSIDITELTRGNSLLEMKVESAHLYKDAFSGLSTAEQYAKSVTERGMKSKGETIAEKADISDMLSFGRSNELFEMKMESVGRATGVEYDSRFGFGVAIGGKVAKTRTLASLQDVGDTFAKNVRKMLEDERAEISGEREISRVRERTATRERTRGELGTIKDEITRLMDQSELKERSIRAASRSDNPSIRQRGKEMVGEQMEIESRIDALNDKFSRIRQEKFDVGKARAERTKSAKEMLREQEKTLERSRAGKTVFVIGRGGRQLEQAISFMESETSGVEIASIPWIAGTAEKGKTREREREKTSIRQKEREVSKLMTLQSVSGVEISSISEKTSPRTIENVVTLEIPRVIEKVREIEKERVTPRVKEREIERTKVRPRERERERERESVIEQTTDRVTERTIEKINALKNTRVREILSLESERERDAHRGTPKGSRYGRRKRTYANTFGSFTAFNRAMQKAGKSIENQTKKNERSGKQTSIKKFTGKW